MITYLLEFGWDRLLVVGKHKVTSCCTTLWRPLRVQGMFEVAVVGQLQGADLAEGYDVS